MNRTLGAAAALAVGGGLVRSLWRPRVLGAWRFPPAGPVIVAGNHASNIDGPLLVAVAPRQVHFLTKQEAFVGPLGTLLRTIGQVPVDRSAADRTAVTAALDLLKDDRVLGIFPEGTRGSGDFAEVRAGLAYFALRSGAPVVPVACFGTAEEGRLLKALPPVGRPVTVVFGEPFTVDPVDGRRAGRKALDAASGQVQERLAAHFTAARDFAGIGEQQPER